MPGTVRSGLSGRVWAAAAAITIMSAAMTGAKATASPVLRARAGTPGPAGLSAVSCPGSSWCMAVGSYVDRSGVRHALALVWNGRTWRALRNPPGGVLRSVSCSSASFCMARSGLTGRTELWNGRTWRVVASPKHASTAPSCGSRSLCMLINGSGFAHSGSVVESWNGRAWRTWWRKASLCSESQGQCFTADVSCGSSAGCVAVGVLTMTGGSEQVVTGLRWHRGNWVRFFDLPFDGNPATVGQISCAGTSCMAAGAAFQDVRSGDIAAAAAWDAKTGSWTDVSPDLGVITCSHGGFNPCSWTRTISCGSRTNCMTITVAHGTLAWNGTTWKTAPFRPAGRGADLVALSCHQSRCMAVGHKIVRGRRVTLAEAWNGTTWKIVATSR